jgi:DNA-binding NarL/FixJ family response regulator
MTTRVVIAAGRGALRLRLRKALTAAGFEVTAECKDAQEAVEAVARDRPDICIVDSDLPGGALVASAAIALPSPPPAVLVVVVDPHGTDAALRAAEIAGASAYLRGDLDEDRLADVVSGLLRE